MFCGVAGLHREQGRFKEREGDRKRESGCEDGEEKRRK